MMGIGFRGVIPGRGFLKEGYPQIIHFIGIFSMKSSDHFWRPPLMATSHISNAYHDPGSSPWIPETSIKNSLQEVHHWLHRFHPMFFVLKKICWYLGLHAHPEISLRPNDLRCGCGFWSRGLEKRGRFTLENFWNMGILLWRCDWECNGWKYRDWTQNIGSLWKTTFLKQKGSSHGVC